MLSSILDSTAISISAAGARDHEVSVTTLKDKDKLCILKSSGGTKPRAQNSCWTSDTFK